MADVIEDTEGLAMLAVVLMILGLLAWLAWKFGDLFKTGKVDPTDNPVVNRVMTGDPTVSAGEDLSRWKKIIFGDPDQEPSNDEETNVYATSASYFDDPASIALRTTTGGGIDPTESLTLADPGPIVLGIENWIQKNRVF